MTLYLCIKDKVEPYFAHWSLLKTDTWGPFIESPANFSGQESYFMTARFTSKI